jgi:hypothetical protein
MSDEGRQPDQDPSGAPGTLRKEWSTPKVIIGSGFALTAGGVKKPAEVSPGLRGGGTTTVS